MQDVGTSVSVTTIHCNTLYLTATRYVTLQQFTTRAGFGHIISQFTLQQTATHTGCLDVISEVDRNSLQHVAAHCNSLQHSTAHRSILQPAATHCNTLQLTTTLSNALQLTATQCNTPRMWAHHQLNRKP